MEFIGDPDGTPAPRLKDAQLENDPEEELAITLNFIRKMYLEAHLVHGDLSEFNILYYHGKQTVIDVSQAVSIYHNNAPVYLERDIRNVINYFHQYLPESKLPNGQELAKEIIRSDTTS
jgi:RIO kinase 1